ncbi:VOC family protein [Saccharopolyspora sp. 5N708]|uniref:VOC family protein n=1 Tax=Saccharopolyspora sp. 5N708 TaxID=3457424 RepID=UPI003FD64F98
MGLEWEQTVVDAANPAMLGRWWTAALGWVVINDSPTEYEIRPAPDRLPGLVFVPVPEAKSGKNRLHIDLRPDDQAAEVRRLLELGAKHAHIGQRRTVPWVVLADPEGNEFCVLGERHGHVPFAESSAGGLPI